MGGSLEERFHCIFHEKARSSSHNATKQERNMERMADSGHKNCSFLIFFSEKWESRIGQIKMVFLIFP